MRTADRTDADYSHFTATTLIRQSTCVRMRPAPPFIDIRRDSTTTAQPQLDNDCTTAHSRLQTAGSDNSHRRLKCPRHQRCIHISFSKVNTCELSNKFSETTMFRQILLDL